MMSVQPRHTCVPEADKLQRPAGYSVLLFPRLRGSAVRHRRFRFLEWHGSCSHDRSWTLRRKDPQIFCTAAQVTSQMRALNGINALQ
jgi:hypothetical protein